MDCLALRHARCRRRLITAAAAAALMLARLHPAAAAAAARSWQPLVVRGAEFPSLVGSPIAKIEVLALHNGRLAPIPFQIDQIAADGKYALPDGPEPTSPQNPGILEPEDQLALMISDLGDKCADDCKPPPGAMEIDIADPLGDPDRYAYVAAVANPETNPTFYVRYDPNIDRVEADSYRMTMTHQLPVDLSFQDRMYAGGPNMIDRIKVRASARVLGIFHYRMNEDDVRNRLLAWKAGPIRIIRRLSHSVDIILGIRSPEVVSENYFYRNYIDNPFHVHFPWVPRLLFGDIHVRIDLDFTDARGYELMWSGMTQPPVKIGDFAAEQALQAMDPRPRIRWIAMRSAQHTIIQTLRPSPLLQLVERRLYFRDDPDVPDPPERVPGENPGVGYLMTGWEKLSSGDHVIDSLLISVPGDYDPDVLLRELRQPVQARVRPAGQGK
jgi:hypothetical protein